MNPVMIDDTVREGIKQLRDLAFANPVALETLKAAAERMNINDHTTRDSEFDALQDRFAILVPMGYKVVFTVEHQPMGMCRHLSMSSPTPGRAPIPAAVQMVMDEFGFEHPLQECHVYPEKFGDNWVAINVIEPISY